MTERIGETTSMEQMISDPESFAYIRNVAPYTRKVVDKLIEGHREDPTDPHFELWLRYLLAYSQIMSEFRKTIRSLDPAEANIPVHQELTKLWVGKFVLPEIERTSSDFTEEDRYSLELLREGDPDIINLNFFLEGPQRA